MATKLVNGVRMPLSPQEEMDRIAEEAALEVPLTEAEVDAIKQERAERVFEHDETVKALARVVFKLLKRLNAVAPAEFPDLTPEDFKELLKAEIEVSTDRRVRQ